MANPNAAQIQVLKNKCRTQRGHFTRLSKALERACDFASTSMDEASTSELMDVFRRYKAKSEDVISILDELSSLDPDNFALYEANSQETEGLYQDASEHYFELLKTLQPPPAALAAPPVAAQPYAGAGPAPGVQYRVFEALKPYTLSRDNTPTELREWVTRFRSYYTASHLDQLGIPEQQAFFKAVLEPKLCAKISEELQATTPIFGANGCIAVLEAEFALQYPLFNRRLDYFRLKHPAKTKFTDFAAKLKVVAQEADMATVTLEDLHMFCYMMECSDWKLQQKFLKQLNPTLAGLDAIARAHEASEAAYEKLHGQVVNQVKHKNQGKNKKNTPGKSDQKKSFKPRIDKSDLEGKCYRCGGDHAADSCGRKSAVCNNCGKTGHIAPVCYGGKKGSDKKGSKGKKSTQVSRASSSCLLYTSPSPRD